MDPPCGTGRSQLVETLFAQAVQLDREACADLLERACGTDAALRAEVESLLASDTADDHFIRAAVSGAAMEAFAPASSGEDVAGRRIGPYRILDRIGEGGMGEVFRASREDQFEMQVALKLIRRGADPEFSIRQFQQERQILAWLEHPNIARLLDGGTTGEGLPYFVMEYVEGRPVDRYCREANLDVTERLRLFLPVCAAVQYAHQHLIVHRDLKPGNILITAQGVPKLLDFGIAKLLGPGGQGGNSTLTSRGIRLMTREYASPEQMAGLPLTTSTDIYSLGVVLYELVTGRWPYRITRSGPLAVEHAVLESEPIDPRALTKQADRDLANLILMALRKEPQRRYASAESFSQDIRRYLEGRPILARKDTLPYRSGKFVQRHKLAVALAVLAGITSAAGVVAIRNEGTRSARRFEQVRKLAHTVLFDFHDAIAPLPGTTKARHLLVATAVQYLDSLSGEARGDPRLQLELAAAYEKVGDVQGKFDNAHLDQPQAAVESYRKGLAVAESLPESRQSLELRARFYWKIGEVQYELLGDPSQARGNLETACRIADSISGKTGDPVYRLRAETVRSLSGLDTFRDPAGARRLMEKSLEIARQWAAAEPGPDSRVYEARVLGEQGSALWQTGDLENAYSLALEAGRLMEGLVKEQPGNVQWQELLAVQYEHEGSVAGHPMYFNLGDRAAAAGWFEKMVAILERLVAADPEDMRAQFNLSEGLAELASSLRESNPVRSETLYRRSLDRNQAIVRSKPGDLLAPRWQAFNRTGLAWVLSHSGRHGEAVEELKKAIAIQEMCLRKDPTDRLFRQELAVMLRALGSETGSEDDLRRSLEMLTPLWQANPRQLSVLRDLADTYEALGSYQARRGDWPAARSWFARSLELWSSWPTIAVSSRYDMTQKKRVSGLLEQADRLEARAAR